MISFKGRINKLDYSLTVFSIMFIVNLLSYIKGYYVFIDSIYYFISFMSCWVLFAATIKRLHDINLNGIFSLILFIPIVNLILVIFLFFKSSYFYNNIYG